MMAAYFEVEAPKRLDSYLTDHLCLQPMTSFGGVEASLRMLCNPSLPGPETRR